MKDIRDLIINNYIKLTESDRFIAKTILNHPNTVHMNTIDDLAEFCSVSKSTIIRFTKKLGLEGFSELKVLLKINQNVFYKVDDNSIDHICDDEIQVINYYRNYNFTPIIKMLEKSPTIYAFGTGMFQRSFNKELQRLFMHIGIWVRLIDSTGELKSALNLMKENDTIVIVSLSGENKFLNNNFELLKLKGINILSFTNSSSNSLVYASTFNISTGLNQKKIRNQFYFDNIATLYTPLKILFARYVDYQVNKLEENKE